MMNFPEKLKEKDNWVVHLNKVPQIPRTNQKASVTDSETWTSFEAALKSYGKLKCIGAGLGFVFSPSDNFIGIDLDHCVKDGLIEKWAEEIIYNINSYTEFSFSGTGFHIILESGKLPDGLNFGRLNKDRGIEICSSKKYFTMTGNVFNKVSINIENRETELDELFKEYFPDKKLELQISFDNLPILSLTDKEIFSKINKAKNNKKFKDLWNGKIPNNKSHSEADFILCSLLAFWTHKDPARIDKMFRQSKLMRDKWDSGSNITYGHRTIQRAINKCNNVAKYLYLNDSNTHL